MKSLFVLSSESAKPTIGDLSLNTRTSLNTIPRAILTPFAYLQHLQEQFGSQLHPTRFKVWRWEMQFTNILGYVAKRSAGSGTLGRPARILAEQTHIRSEKINALRFILMLLCLPAVISRPLG